MERLEKKIEGILTTDLESVDNTGIFESSIENCTNKIAQEVKDIAIAFAKYRERHVVQIESDPDTKSYTLNNEQLFNDFIQTY